MAAPIYKRLKRSQACLRVCRRGFRLGALCVALGLAVPATVRAGDPKAAKTQVKPTFTVELTQTFLDDLVTAAAPFEDTETYEVGALGITKEITTKIRLTNPHVKVHAGHITVPLEFDASDESGLVSAHGNAAPELRLEYDAKKSEFVARLTKANISLGGIGTTLAIEDLVDPIPIPGVVPADIELPHKTLSTEVRISDIQIATGVVRIHGTAVFKPVQPKPSPKP